MSNSSYHDRIINLTNKRSLSMFVDLSAKQHYEEGFRNARKKSAEIALEAEREIEELKEKNSELYTTVHELYAMGFLTETFDSGCDHKELCNKVRRLLKG